MTTEEDTFRALVKLPFDEVYQKVEEAFRDSNQGISPVYKLGPVVVERRTYYNPVVIKHYTLMKILEESHWTFEEFALACEKKAIIEQVKEYNDSLEFPQEIISRAREFFPNLKFTPAKLDLE